MSFTVFLDIDLTVLIWRWFLQIIKLLKQKQLLYSVTVKDRIMAISALIIYPRYTESLKST